MYMLFFTGCTTLCWSWPPSRFRNSKFFRDGVISPMANPQTGEPRSSLRLAWATLPGAYASVTIARWVIGAIRNPNQRFESHATSDTSQNCNMTRIAIIGCVVIWMSYIQSYNSSSVIFRPVSVFFTLFQKLPVPNVHRPYISLFYFQDFKLIGASAPPIRFHMAAMLLLMAAEI
jgi:hypothetical protein